MSPEGFETNIWDYIEKLKAHEWIYITLGVSSCSVILHPILFLFNESYYYEPSQIWIFDINAIETNSIKRKFNVL